MQKTFPKKLLRSFPKAFIKRSKSLFLRWERFITKLETNKKLKAKIHLWALVVVIFSCMLLGGVNPIHFFIPGKIFSLPKLQIRTPEKIYAFPRKSSSDSEIVTLTRKMNLSPNKEIKIRQLALAISQAPNIKDVKLNFGIETLPMPSLGLTIQKIWIIESDETNDEISIDFSQDAIKKEISSFFNYKEVSLKKQQEYFDRYLLLLSATLKEHFSTAKLVFLLDGNIIK